MFRLTSFPRLRLPANGPNRVGLPSRWVQASQLSTSRFTQRERRSESSSGGYGNSRYNKQPAFGTSNARERIGSSSNPPRRGSGQPYVPSSRFGRPSNLSPTSDKPKRPDSLSSKAPPSQPQLLLLLSQRLPKWCADRKTGDRLEMYLHGHGGEKGLVGRLLKEFEGVMEGGFRELGLGNGSESQRMVGGKGMTKDLTVSKARGDLGSLTEQAQHLNMTGWDFQGLGTSLRYDEDWIKALDRALIRRFLSWLVSPPHSTRSNLSTSTNTHHPSLPSSIVTRLQTLLQTTDLTSLPRTFTSTREMHRHFHLHIGPTNSGKTYNALKSLALAETGSYAGPLRLLAHEVWERMNRGTVGGLEEGRGRECNLITGEERRIVSIDAGLTSCTVEMMSASIPQDVVVIDEIQMIGDSQRGGSWTNAIMGVQANEVHLCGEETVIGVITNMVTSMNDQLTIHRYERLTPLIISEKSLEGDLGKISKGDCVVAFSRSGIFAMKKAIEQKTGLRCAVVYGALPPETRAEQAKLFNDENSGVDVMVASDAVGMGLNLKIKRMIFEALHKWNGKAEVPLSISQVKQIAGRAGRYGQHSTGAVGEVTTLNPTDLPLLRRVMPSSLPAVPRAVIEAPYESLAELSLLLPSDTPFSTLLDEFSELARVPTYCVYKDMAPSVTLATSLNGFGDVLSLKEMAVFAQAPVNVRDDKVVTIFQAYLHAYAHDGEVDVAESLESSRLIPTLEMVELAREALRPNPVAGRPDGKEANPAPIPPEVVAAIPSLESLHKALVLYIWLSFRFDLAFTQRTQAEAIKLRVEDSLEECLERLPGIKLGKRTARRTPAPELHQRQGELKETKISWMSRDDYRRMDLDRRFGGQDLLPPPSRARGGARGRGAESRWS